MKYSILEICFLLVLLILPNILFSQDECRVEFENIYGIEDFTLGTDIQNIEYRDEMTEWKEAKNGSKTYKKYTLDKNVQTAHIDLKIEYMFTFLEGKLIAYEFQIDLNSDIYLYEKLIEQLKEHKRNLDFINGEKLKYWYTNDVNPKCHKYIRLVSSKKSFFIKGGISNLQ